MLKLFRKAAERPLPVAEKANDPSAQTETILDYVKQSNRASCVALNLLQAHNFELSNIPYAKLLLEPALVGLSADDFTGMSEPQKRDLVAGEYLYLLSQIAGEASSKLLMRARWGYGSPEWYDHRNHLLDPDVHFTDFWTSLADIAIEKMPLNAKVLDLCSGDGFYAYHFFRHRAEKIVCVERDAAIHRHAVRLHSAPNIEHVNMSVLDFEPADNEFDVVSIRGAIEHFSSDDQAVIFRKALGSLRPGGWFCGDTPANPDPGTHLLPSHECEWADEAQMRASLSRVFDIVNTRVLETRTRTVLMWQCQKPL